MGLFLDPHFYPIDLYVYPLPLPHSFDYHGFAVSFGIELWRHLKGWFERNDNQFNKQLPWRYITILVHVPTEEFPKLYFKNWIHVKTYSNNDSLCDRMNKETSCGRLVFLKLDHASMAAVFFAIAIYQLFSLSLLIDSGKYLIVVNGNFILSIS